MFRPCRYVTKPCNLGLLATCSGKHAYKKTETSVPFGPFVKETSHHFTPVSEAPLSPSPFDAALPLRMSCGHAAGAWPARCHTICDASHSLPFRRPALFHGPPPSTQFWAPGVGGTGGSPYNNIYIYIISSNIQLVQLVVLTNSSFLPIISLCVKSSERWQLPKHGKQMLEDAIQPQRFDNFCYFISLNKSHKNL